MVINTDATVITTVHVISSGWLAAWVHKWVVTNAVGTIIPTVHVINY